MRLFAAAAVAIALAAPSNVRADGEVTIALTPEGDQLAAELGLSPAELEAELQGELEDYYQTANVDGFLRSFANATSFASRGIGVDYAPLFRGVELGVTANIAAAVEGLDPSQEPAAGIAPNLSLFAGLSLAAWGHDNIALYGNGFRYSASMEGLRGSITNIGFHAQYHLAFPSRDASALLFLWSGLHLTAGVELSRWSFDLEDSLDHSFAIEGGTGQSLDIDSRATGAFNLAATSTTIPIEVTTSARIFYLAGIYFGAGIDLQYGRASADAALDATMRGTDPLSGDDVEVGTATVTADGTGTPSPVAFHILTGLELNLWRLKAFVQATLVPIEGASVAFGIRLRL